MKVNWRVVAGIVATGITGAAGIVAANVVDKYAGIPTRVSVLEAKYDGIDRKLDRALEILEKKGE